MKFSLQFNMTFAVLAVGLSFRSAPGQDGFLQQTAVHGDGSGAGTLPFTNIHIGPESGSSSGSGIGTGNGNQTASAIADLQDELSNSSFANGSSDVSSDRAGNFVPSAVGNTGFIYGDEISLVGDGPLPPQIRVHFQASGMLNTSAVGTTSSQAYSSARCYARGTSFAGFYSQNIGVEAMVELGNPNFGQQTAYVEVRTDWLDFQQGVQTTQTFEGDWDDLHLAADGSFSGSFHYDVSFDNAINGYDFEIYFGTSARAEDSFASTSGSISVTAVTDIDDSPLAGFVVSFVSGRELDNITILGDVNMDGTVNLLDVEPFIEAVATGVYQAEADTNQDGVVNLLDVVSFIDLLSR